MAFWKRYPMWLWLPLATFFAGAIWGILFIAFLDLPDMRKLESFSPKAATRIYDQNGDVLGEIFLERRYPITIDKVPKRLIFALTTIEDVHFFEHQGVSPKGIARAFIRNLTSGRFAQGGSTLTQQLAKVLFLSPEKTITRKIKEALLSFKIESSYTKEEILEFYLNQIFFGSGNYGIVAASRFYFCKEPEALDLVETAALAAIPKGPSIYSPLRNPERNRERRNLILEKMLEGHLIGNMELERAQAQELNVQECREAGMGNHAVSWIVGQLENEFGADRARTDQLEVFSTIEKSRQKLVADAFNDELDKLNRRLKTKSDPIEGAAILMNGRTGEVLAMVGGRDFTSSQFNRATLALRQSGSTFKPLVYATAIEKGYSQNSIVQDVPLSFPDGRGGEYSPQNYTEDFRGAMTLRRSLQLSRNTVSVSLTHRLGLKEVHRQAQALGIDHDLPYDLTVAIGSASLTLKELTQSYTAFVNEGVALRAYGIREVKQNGVGLNLFDRPVPNQAISPETAYIMRDMLGGVFHAITAKRFADFPCALGGKTGTTNRYTDALFIGYVGDLVLGVRVGRDDNTSMGPQATGSRAAFPIWWHIARDLCSTLERDEIALWDPPQTLTRATIDRRNGLRTDAACPFADTMLVKRDALSEQFSPCR